MISLYYVFYLPKVWAYHNEIEIWAWKKSEINKYLFDAALGENSFDDVHHVAWSVSICHFGQRADVQFVCYYAAMFFDQVRPQYWNERMKIKCMLRVCFLIKFGHNTETREWKSNVCYDSMFLDQVRS